MQEAAAALEHEEEAGDQRNPDLEANSFRIAGHFTREQGDRHVQPDRHETEEDRDQQHGRS